jgi:hypothetical protein
MDLQSISAQVLAHMSADPLSVLLIVLVIAALVRIVMLSSRITLLTQGADGKSLEGTIQALTARAHALEAHAQKTELALNNLDERVKGAIRGVAVKRFDPFQNAGGQQSFTSAFVDESGSGVVISGIHARDSVRVYAKELSKFTSDRELSDDEQAAIADAQKRLS